MQIANKEEISKIDLFLFKYSKVPLSEKLFFTQYLGIMLKAGISLSGALSALARQTTSKHFAFILRDIFTEVEKGTSLAASLKKHQNVFGELYVNMVESGETSGRLEEVLTYLYLQMKKNHALTSKIKGAMIYPLVIIVAMVAVVTFLFIFIIPQLTGFLDSFGSALPWPTKILIAISNFFMNHGLWAALATLLFLSAVTILYRNKSGRYFIHGIFLKIPVFSRISKQINLARFARTLSSLLKTDIMIVKIFEMTANSLSNLHYRRAVWEIGEKIKRGSQINRVMDAYPHLFTPVTCQIILVGEETGQLDQMLGELAEFYENEVDETLKNLPSIIEPLLVLILGICVGIIALAIMMPLYALTMSLSI